MCLLLLTVMCFALGKDIMGFLVISVRLAFMRGVHLFLSSRKSVPICVMLNRAEGSLIRVNSDPIIGIMGDLADDG